MIGFEAVKNSRSRRQIALDDPAALRRWTKHLKVTEDELRCAIEKVGNSVVAVRKQMGLVR
jgi:hypothetical protein